MDFDAFHTVYHNNHNDDKDNGINDNDKIDNNKFTQQL